MVLLAKKRRYFEKEGDDNKITEIIAVKTLTRRQPPAGREHVGPDMIAGSHAFSLKPLLQLAAHRDIPCSFKQGCNAFISA